MAGSLYANGRLFQIDLKFNNWEIDKMKGFYTVDLAGALGPGHRVFMAIKGGEIVGVDELGIVIEGTYSRKNFKELFADVSLKLKAPPGARSIAKVIAGPGGLVQEINIRLPSDIGDGELIDIETPIGLVTAVFYRLRDLL